MKESKMRNELRAAGYKDDKEVREVKERRRATNQHDKEKNYIKWIKSRKTRR